MDEVEFSDMMDLAIILAEKSTHLLISTYILLSPLFLLGYPELAILPPLLASIFFGASMLYSLAREKLLGIAPGKGRTLSFIPLFASLTMLVNMLVSYTSLVAVVYTAITLAVILLLRIHSSRRDYTVIMNVPWKTFFAEESKNELKRLL
ncbi:MAG: hypothetical protein LM590_00850 [Thermofilum sp.]|jgi:hypothetical protein|nr:hypothetical protein [Thermofilum sp.]